VEVTSALHARHSWRVPNGESVQIASSASTNTTSAALPSWEARWSIGLSYVLP
jgi:hypothetical protein